MKKMAALALLGSLVAAGAQKDDQPHFDAIAINPIAANSAVPDWHAGNGGLSGGTRLIDLINFAYDTIEVEKAP